MSADNTICVFNFKDQSRVVHAQAIENLWWDYKTFSEKENFVPTRVFEYCNGGRSFSNSQLASDYAFQMLESLPVVEYGVQRFDIDKTWQELVFDAKEHAKVEIESIVSGEDKFAEKYEIPRLKEIVDWHVF